MVTMKGVLERISFLNQDDHYTIAELRIAKISCPITIVGHIEYVSEGDSLEVSGSWILDDRNEDRFRFRSYKNLTTGICSTDHNEICREFKNQKKSEEFITKFTIEGCKKINKITLEKIVSNNNIIIGYCDVVIDYEDGNGNIQTLLIEVKSSSEVIESDANKVLRQIKKYKFYLKKVTKTFLIYSGQSLSNETKEIFTDEEIVALKFS